MTPLIDTHTYWLAYRIAGDFFTARMDRDDLTQEALIGALQARASYRPDLGSFSHHEARCMRRRLIDVVRSARSASRGEGRREDEIPTWHHAAADLSLEAKEALALVRQLPLREQRAVISLAAGLTYQEIAEAEGVTTKRVDNDLRLARARLRLAA